MLGRRGAARGTRVATDDTPSCEEARLLDRIATGDLRAFEDLYRRYHPRLTRFLSHMIHRPQLVEEALNDTMIEVWNKAGAFDGTSKPSTWIFSIAYRKGLKALKGRDEPVEDRHAETRRSLEAGPEQALDRRQVQQRLVEAMGELTPDHRMVVDLTYFHEMGYREIAQIMDCPVDTVKTRMFHARRRLKDKLAGGLSDWL